MKKKMILLAIGFVLTIFGFATTPEAYGYACIAVGGFVFGWGLEMKK
jgi:hypothetical protein